MRGAEGGNGRSVRGCHQALGASADEGKREDLPDLVLESRDDGATVHHWGETRVKETRHGCVVWRTGWSLPMSKVERRSAASSFSSTPAASEPRSATSWDLSMGGVRGTLENGNVVLLPPIEHLSERKR